MLLYYIFNCLVLSKYVIPNIKLPCRKATVINFPILLSHTMLSRTRKKEEISGKIIALVFNHRINFLNCNSDHALIEVTHSMHQEQNCCYQEQYVAVLEITALGFTNKNNNGVVQPHLLQANRTLSRTVHYHRSMACKREIRTYERK